MAEESKRCGAPTVLGTPCTHAKLKGFPACFTHLPEELISAAERHGYKRCKGIVKADANPRKGERCALHALAGSDFCDFHGPKDNWLVPRTPHDRAMVRRIHKVAEEQGVDTTRVANPLQALLEIADEASMLKDELKRRVIALEEDAWRYEGMAGEQIRGEILLYERALDRCAKLMITLTRLGIEERLARVTERQGQLINKALEYALEESGIALKDQDKIRAALARHLKAVE